MLDKFLKYILYLISHISFHQIDEKEEVVLFEYLMLLIKHKVKIIYFGIMMINISRLYGLLDGQ